MAAPISPCVSPAFFTSRPPRSSMTKRHAYTHTRTSCQEKSSCRGASVYDGSSMERITPAEEPLDSRPSKVFWDRFGRLYEAGTLGRKRDGAVTDAVVAETLGVDPAT